jgi:hypothetical protein
MLSHGKPTLFESCSSPCRSCNDVDDDQEGRPALVVRQRLGVGLGLAAGADHGVVPGGGAADGGAFLRFPGGGGEEGELLGALLVAALLGFEREAAALVEIDAAGAAGAVGVAEGDGALEDVGVAGVVGLARVRTRDVQEIAEFREEELIVGALGGGRALSARYEGGDAIRCRDVRHPRGVGVAIHWFPRPAPVYATARRRASGKADDRDLLPTEWEDQGGAPRCVPRAPGAPGYLHLSEPGEKNSPSPCGRG